MLMKAAQQRGGSPSARELESIWVATDSALHFIAPLVNQALLWPWEHVDLLPIKQGRKLAKVGVKLSNGDQYELRTGASGYDNLLAIHEWASQL
jgi:hypothetical protein